MFETKTVAILDETNYKGKYLLAFLGGYSFSMDVASDDGEVVCEAAIDGCACACTPGVCPRDAPDDITPLSIECAGMDVIDGCALEINEDSAGALAQMDVCALYEISTVAPTVGGRTGGTTGDTTTESEGGTVGGTEMAT